MANGRMFMFASKYMGKGKQNAKRQKAVASKSEPAWTNCSTDLNWISLFSSMCNLLFIVYFLLYILRIIWLRQLHLYYYLTYCSINSQYRWKYRVTLKIKIITLWIFTIIIENNVAIFPFCDLKIKGKFSLKVLFTLSKYVIMTS